MDIVNNALDIHDICRLCMEKALLLKPIFPPSIEEESADEWDDYNTGAAKYSISEQILIVTGLKVDLYDEYPKFMCSECFKKLEYCIQFRENCNKSFEVLKEQVSNAKANGSSSLNMSDTTLTPKWELELLKDFPDHLFINDNSNVHQTDDNTSSSQDSKKRYSTPRKSTKYNIFGKSTKGSLKSLMGNHKSHKHDSSPRSQSFTCNTFESCNKNFESLKDLVLHIKVDHSKVPNNRCCHCSKAYFTTFALERHTQTHNTKQYVSCEQCCKKFSSKNKLKIHVRRHTRETKVYKESECEICGMKFATNCALNNHLKDIHVTI